MANNYKYILATAKTQRQRAAIFDFADVADRIELHKKGKGYEVYKLTFYYEVHLTSFFQLFKTLYPQYKFKINFHK